LSTRFLCVCTRPNGVDGAARVDRVHVVAPRSIVAPTAYDAALLAAAYEARRSGRPGGFRVEVQAPTGSRFIVAVDTAGHPEPYDVAAV